MVCSQISDDAVASRKRAKRRMNAFPFVQQCHEENQLYAHETTLPTNACYALVRIKSRTTTFRYNQLKLSLTQLWLRTRNYE